MPVIIGDKNGRTSEILEGRRHGRGGLGRLLLGRGAEVLERLLFLDVVVDGFLPLALGAHEVQGRVHPVLDHELSGLDFAGTPSVDVLGDGSLAVPAEAVLLLIEDGGRERWRGKRAGRQRFLCGSGIGG